MHYRSVLQCVCSLNDISLHPAIYCIYLTFCPGPFTDPACSLFLIFSSPRGPKLSDCLADIWRGPSGWYLTFLTTGPSWLSTIAQLQHRSSIMNWTLNYSTRVDRANIILDLYKACGAVKLIFLIWLREQMVKGSYTWIQGCAMGVNYWLWKLCDVTVLCWPTASHVCQVKAFMICSLIWTPKHWLETEMDDMISPQKKEPSHLDHPLVAGCSIVHING